MQDLLVQHFEQVGRVIHKQEGYLYYCGDISNWDEVCELLAEALYQYTFSSKQEATNYIHNMIVCLLYHIISFEFERCFHLLLMGTKNYSLLYHLVDFFQI